MKHLPTLDSPYSSPASWNALTSPSNSDRCECMPEPNEPSIGFGMNVAYTPRSAATCLTDHAERHHVVGHRERVGVAEVDLVLARAELVEAVLDRDAHRFERDDVWRRSLLTMSSWVRSKKPAWSSGLGSAGDSKMKNSISGAT